MLPVNGVSTGRVCYQQGYRVFFDTCQVLMKEQKVLQNDRPLTFYGIGDGDEVTLTLNLEGAGEPQEIQEKNEKEEVHIVRFEWH